MAGFEAPNYTQTPNALFDTLLARIDSICELKVTLAVIRKTFGFHKQAGDVISLSQLERMTGLPRKSVVDGVSRAMKRGSIIREQSGNSYLYALKVVTSGNYQSDQVVTSGNHLVVTSGDPQKKLFKESNTTSNEVVTGKPVATNPFTYFCDKLDELGLEVTPEDRKRVPGNLTRVKNKHELNEFQMRRLVTEMIEARLRDYPMSPQEAFNKMNGITKKPSAKPEPINPHGDEGTQLKDKPYPASWYIAAYDDVTPAVIDGLIASLGSHSKILDWLEGRSGDHAQAAQV